MDAYVGLDFGATRLRAAVADDTAEVTATVRRNTPSANDPESVQDAIQQAVINACSDAGVSTGDIVAAGIGSIGPLDFEAGVVLDPPNLPDSIERVELVDTVRRCLGLETNDVTLLNDSTAGLVGERFYLGEFDHPVPDDMVYLTFSTGISAGVAVDGHVLHRNVGEVGHWVVDPEGAMRCGCGRTGHWEAYCGGKNVPAYARHLYDQKDIDTDLAVESPELDARTIFLNASRDDLARLTVERIADWNEIGVVNVIHAFDPAVVAVGGAVALENEARVIDSLRDRIQGATVVDEPEIRPTRFGGDVVVRGALAAVIAERERGDARR